MDNSSVIFIVTLAVAFIFLRWLIQPVPEQNELQQEMNRAQGRAQTRRSGNGRRQVTETMIEVVQTIAPTLTREQIIHDLNRTGSVEETVERYMENNTLPFPPTAAPQEERNHNEKPTITKPINLMERYNIDVSKLDDAFEDGASKDLNRRKQEMIVAARKRLAKQLNEPSNEPSEAR